METYYWPSAGAESPFYDLSYDLNADKFLHHFANTGRICQGNINWKLLKKLTD